jgi:hypothetical protein
MVYLPSNVNTISIFQRFILMNFTLQLSAIYLFSAVIPSVLHTLRRFLWVWQVALPGITRIRHELVMQPVAVNILAGVASFLLSWACHLFAAQ